MRPALAVAFVFALALLAGPPASPHLPPGRCSPAGLRHLEFVARHGHGRPARSHARAAAWCRRVLERRARSLSPRAAIRLVFPAETEGWALAIAGCETGGTFWPGATNGQFVNIFQMGLSERRRYGWHVAGSPPVLAARAALRYSRGGWHWGPWPECRARLGLPS